MILFVTINLLKDLFKSSIVVLVVSIDEIDEKFSRMILFVTIDLLKNLFKSSIVVIVTCFFKLIKKS